MATLDRALRPCLALSFALVGLALTAASAAASSWITPEEPVASSITLRGAPVVGIDEAGQATELWTSQEEGETSVLESSTRPAGGSWTPAVTVPSEGHPEEPVLAVSPEGVATAAWIDHQEGGSPQVWSSERAPGGAWTAAVRISVGAPQRGVHGLSVVAGASGSAIVAWYEYPEGIDEQWLEAATRQGSSWHATERISQQAGIWGYEHPALATDGHGGFVAVWGQYDWEGSVYSIVAAEQREGVWQGNDTLMTGHESLGEPNVAENAAGEATALWVDYELEQSTSASLRGGQWTLKLLEGGTADNQCFPPQPQVGIDAAGSSTAAWVDTAGNIFTAELPAGGMWAGLSRLTEFPEGTVARGLSLGEDPAGDAALVWNRLEYGDFTLSVEGTYRRAGQTWETPAPISPGAENLSEPTLAMDATGDALTSWGTGLYEPHGRLSYAFVGAPPVSTPAPTKTASGVASGSPSAPSGLAPVYLVLPRSRLHLHRGSRTLTATIHNSNSFPVTGTATMSWFLLPAAGAHTARSHANPKAAPIATVATFSLPADGSARVSFRLSARALRRLFAYVPDAGHDLISIRLAVRGADGRHSSGDTVYALDAALGRRAHNRRLIVPRGYRAPVDPWVKAHAAC